MGGADAAGGMVEFFINVLGQSRADAEHNAALAVRSDGLTDWTNMTAPDLQPLDVQEQGRAGISDFTEDANLRGYQLKALEGLGREVEYEGNTPEDQAAFNRARQEAGSMDAGFRGAAEHQQAARGMNSSTGAYMAALQGGQQATNRAADMDVQAAADSRQRYLQALSGLSSQSGAMRGQEFGIANQRASAQDAINRFNTGQRTANGVFNQGQVQQNFTNNMDLAKGRSGAMNTYADSLDSRGDRAERTAAKWGAASKNFLGGMGGGGGGGLPF